MGPDERPPMGEEAVRGTMGPDPRQPCDPSMGRPTSFDGGRTYANRPYPQGPTYQPYVNQPPQYSGPPPPANRHILTKDEREALKHRTRFQRFWDWADYRDIDKHLVALFTLSLTYTITTWAMAYAEAHTNKSGLEVAAIIGAVTAPYMALQGAVIRFYFTSRPPDVPMY